MDVQVNPPGQEATNQAFWSKTGTGANAQVQLTQAAVVGKRNYVSSIEVTAAGATAALDVTVTLQDGGVTVANWTFTFPVGALVAATPLVLNFSTPIQGTAPNQSMVLTVPAGGAGNTNVAANMRGFSQ